MSIKYVHDGNGYLFVYGEPSPFADVPQFVIGDLVPCGKCGEEEDIIINNDWDGEHLIGAWVICACDHAIYVHWGDNLAEKWNEAQGKQP